MKKTGRKIIYICIWLLIWEGFSLFLHNKIMLAGPLETVRALLSLLKEEEFYLSLGRTTGHILAGLFAGSLLGILLSVTAYRSTKVEEFLSPFVTTVKSIPVASFVIILLIWAGNEWTAFYITALVSFPILYVNLLEGLKTMDRRMIEMADLYQIKGIRRLKGIYYPMVKGTLAGSLSLAIGMGFKSGVAAEVIAQPLLTIGNNIYRSKIFLETDRLFAWTIVVVVVSAVVEKLIRFILMGSKKDKRQD